MARISVSCLAAIILFALPSCLVGRTGQLWGAEADQPAVTIDAKFPGGNILVTRIEGRQVTLAPDPRGDSPWFYWYFAASVKTPGRVEFIFPEKVIGARNGGIGRQGPAFSLDNGKTWDWMGRDSVVENVFTYEFAQPNETVRFAVTIPYLAADLSKFLDQHTSNPVLKVTTLTRSRQGAEVPLLQIGTAESDRKPLLVTARHHAVETMASFVLEGFLEAALSDTETGRKFREQYVLLAVPVVDWDGVEAGDQGKNRKPHDHNRDYIAEGIYPETRAIRDLHSRWKFQYAIDFHCPTLVADDHQVMYFIGNRTLPPQNFDNVSLLAERMRTLLPKTAPVGPLNWLKPSDPSPTFARYFGSQSGVQMSVTFEFPFAPPGKESRPVHCRDYGARMLQAFVETQFIETAR